MTDDAAPAPPAGGTDPDPRIQPVTMPKWGLSMKTGKVVDWLAAEGDAITPGTDLADIETDKIAGTLEAAQEGLLRRIVAAVGQDVPVSGVIAVVAPAEVPDAAIDAVVAAAQQAAASGELEPEAGPTVATVAVGGHTVSYATLGEAGPDGDVIVLVHGFGGDKNSWLFVQEPLAAGGSRTGSGSGSGSGSGRVVHAIDLPGHGESSKKLADGTDLAALADVVTGFLDALGIHRAHLVGHSLGGAVVAAAASRAPDRVRSLTLVAPAGYGPDADAAYLREFATASSRRELKPLLGRLFADEALVTRQLVDDVLRYKRLDGVAGALHTLLAVLLEDGGAGDRQAIRTADLLAGSTVPTAVVWGAADRILPAPADRILPAPAAQDPGAPDPAAGAIAGATVRIVGGAGHMVHLESPNTVLEAIESLLP